MEKIKIESSLTGMIPNIINSVIWLILSYTTIYLTSSTISSELLADNLRNWTEGNTLLMSAGIIRIVAWIILCIAVFSLIVELFYDSQEKMIFHLNENGYIKKFEAYDIGFIYKESTHILPCNRITSVSVESSIIDKLLNTGSIDVNFVTFVNSESEEQSWSIRGIKNPHDFKDRIMNASPDHEGFQVQLNEKK